MQPKEILSTTNFIRSFFITAVIGVLPTNSFAQATTFQINIPNMTFVPRQAAILIDTEVIWTNNSSGTHTVTFNQALARLPGSVKLPVGVEPFDSGAVRAGQTFRRVFTIAGEYKYFCRPHETMGHLGDLVVIASQPTATVPALPERPVGPDAPAASQTMDTLHAFESQEVKWVNAALSEATITVLSDSRVDENGQPLVLVPPHLITSGTEFTHVFDLPENAIATVSLVDGRTFTHAVRIWGK